MTIRTESGTPFALDAGDFQLTHAGITVGLEFSFTNSIAGPTSAITIAEKVGAGWESKGLIEMNFGNKLEALGVAKWIETELLPKFNEWLAARFGGVTAPPPATLPEWLPAQMVELDAALRQLKVTVANGVPQVSI